MNGFMSDPRRSAVAYVVSASDAEKSQLWCEWSNQAADYRYGSPDNERVPWEQVHDRRAVPIGMFAEYPVVISVSFAIIYDELVMFYDACSMVVNHDMVKKWLAQNVPAYTEYHTNTTNFGHCMATLRRKYLIKHGLGDTHIHKWLKINGRFKCERCPATKMAVAEK